MSSTEYLTEIEVEMAARRFRERLKAKDPSLMALLAKMRRKPPRASCLNGEEIFMEETFLNAQLRSLGREHVTLRISRD